MDYSSIQAITFDMDGVLVDSTPHHAAAFAGVLSPLGVHCFDYSRFAGQRTIDVLRTVLTENSIDFDASSLAALAASKSERARRGIAQSGALMPDCVEVLQILSEAFPLALASSGSRESVADFLARTATAALFSSIISGDDVTAAKPDPEIYLRSFAALGKHPSSCLVVEDAVAGIQAASSAGAPSLGFCGSQSAVRLIAAGACDTIDCLSALLELFPNRTRSTRNHPSNS